MAIEVTSLLANDPIPSPGRNGNSTGAMAGGWTAADIYRSSSTGEKGEKGMDSLAAAMKGVAISLSPEQRVGQRVGQGNDGNDGNDGNPVKREKSWVNIDVGRHVGQHVGQHLGQESRKASATGGGGGDGDGNGEDKDFAARSPGGRGGAFRRVSMSDQASPIKVPVHSMPQPPDLIVRLSVLITVSRTMSQCLNLSGCCWCFDTFSFKLGLKFLSMC
jgi:hypothetical protein